MGICTTRIQRHWLWRSLAKVLWGQGVKNWLKNTRKKNFKNPSAAGRKEKRGWGLKKPGIVRILGKTKAWKSYYWYLGLSAWDSQDTWRWMKPHSGAGFCLRALYWAWRRLIPYLNNLISIGTRGLALEPGVRKTPEKSGNDFWP